MPTYLILKLKGAMQSWGSHSYEDYRPTENIPTRSGLVGLLGACLGIDRKDLGKQKELSDSFLFAVRADKKEVVSRKIVDFHTVEGVLKVDGTINPYPVITKREYLVDAEFTVAMEFLLNGNGQYNLNTVKQALSKPVFTPVLGRRSCPITRPLFQAEIVANSLPEALSMVEPREGIIYSEIGDELDKEIVIRDSPLFNGKRHFYPRKVYLKK